MHFRHILMFQLSVLPITTFRHSMRGEQTPNARNARREEHKAEAEFVEFARSSFVPFRDINCVGVMRASIQSPKERAVANISAATASAGQCRQTKRHIYDKECGERVLHLRLQRKRVFRSAALPQSRIATKPRNQTNFTMISQV